MARVTRPEEALALARARAAAARERGSYAGAGPDEVLDPAQQITLEQLLERAIAEPDLGEVRSTRRFGAPITLGKRMLTRALRQYDGQMNAHRRNFDIQLAVYIAQLAERVERLEKQRD